MDSLSLSPIFLLNAEIAIKRSKEFTTRLVCKRAYRSFKNQNEGLHSGADSGGDAFSSGIFPPANIKGLSFGNILRHAFLADRH